MTTYCRNNNYKILEMGPSWKKSSYPAGLQEMNLLTAMMLFTDVTQTAI